MPSTKYRVKASKVEKSAFFEIMLYQTRLRYRNPKSTHATTSSFGNETIDQRPFVNTIAKQNYHCDSVLGRCVIDLYHTAWAVQAKSILSKTIGSLDLVLKGIAPSREDQSRYPNMFDQEIAQKWIKNYYECFESFNGGYESDVQSTGPITIEIFSDQAGTFYLTRPQENSIEIFLPFGTVDLLLFSFCIQCKELDQQILAAIESFCKRLVQSAELYNEKGS